MWAPRWAPGWAATRALVWVQRLAPEWAPLWRQLYAMDFRIGTSKALKGELPRPQYSMESAHAPSAGQPNRFALYRFSPCVGHRQCNGVDIPVPEAENNIPWKIAYQPL
eukprot:gene1182-1052_t